MRRFGLLLLGLGLTACEQHASAPQAPADVPKAPVVMADADMRRWRDAAMAAADAGSDAAKPKQMMGAVTEEEFKSMHELRGDQAAQLFGKDVIVGGGRAYLSLPPGMSAPMPAVLVVHEWWGLNDNVRMAADRLAAQGMAALAVDLYGGNVATTPEQAGTYMKSVDPEVAKKILKAGADYLKNDPEIKATKRGAIGWCMGGGFSFQAALAVPDLDADVVFYGFVPTDEKSIKPLKAPLLAIFGTQDKSIPKEKVDAFEATLKKLKKDYKIERVDAGHAFESVEPDLQLRRLEGGVGRGHRLLGCEARRQARHQRADVRLDGADGGVRAQVRSMLRRPRPTKTKLPQPRTNCLRSADEGNDQMSTASADLKSLEAILGKDLSVDADTLATYGRDWTHVAKPAPLAVAFPRTTEQVRDIVLWARKNKVAVVPSGGRTGLSGGAIAAKGELVVSLSKMTAIHDLNTTENTVHCEAGVITETLQKFAHDKGLYYPVDFASRGSSAIGGNIATNAGGIKVLRYGMTREWIAGMTVVTGAGEILKLGNGLVKNATGYDLRHLFIGSEGTLGFVTEATIRLTKPAPPQRLFCLGVDNLPNVMRVFEMFRSAVAISAYETFSDIACELVVAKGRVGKPFGTKAKWYVLVEYDATDADKALATFEKTVEEGLVVDGIAAESSAQAAALWSLREDITEASAPYKPYKNDISVTVSKVPAFLAEVDAVLTKAYPTYKIVWFGHIGDGNLHISILKPNDVEFADFYKACQQVDTLLYGVVRKHGGSVSAEHGVGLTKKPFLSYSRSPEEIAIMKGIKKVLDPDGIMNPGKLFD